PIVEIPLIPTRRSSDLLGNNPNQTDLEKYVDGDFEHAEGPYIYKPFKSGDLFAHTYNGGGGYGDPIERDPLDIARDVENGYVTIDRKSTRLNSSHVSTS